MRAGAGSKVFTALGRCMCSGKGSVLLSSFCTREYVSEGWYSRGPLSGPSLQHAGRDHNMHNLNGKSNIKEWPTQISNKVRSLHNRCRFVKLGQAQTLLSGSPHLILNGSVTSDGVKNHCFTLNKSIQTLSYVKSNSKIPSLQISSLSIPNTYFNTNC